jgi:TadE-like protein
MKSMFKRKANSERGQSLIEMAITLPVLILILSGLMDLGRIYFTAIALEEAAAEAALYLAINPDCPISPGSLDECSDPNNAYYRASNSGGTQEIDWDRATFNIETGATGSPLFMAEAFPDCTGVGCLVIIQLRYQYDFITPVIESIANGVTGGNGLTLEVQATQIIVFE